MKVEACKNKDFIADDSEDEDMPLVFSRRKHNQVSSEIKNSSSSGRPDNQPGKPGSDVRTPNDQNSSALKGKTVSSLKPSSSNLSLGTQKSQPPSSKPLKSLSSSTRPSLSSPPTSNRPSPSPLLSSKRPSPSPPPLSKRPSPSPPPLSKRPSPSPPPLFKRPSPSPPPSSKRPSPSPVPSRAPPVKLSSVNGGSSANHQPKKDISVREGKRDVVAVKEEKSEQHFGDDSDNSDDNKPLNIRCLVGSQKGNSNVGDVENKPSIGDFEDSDDDKPLSARIDKGRATAGSSQTHKLKAVSVKPPDDSDDEKLLSAKLQMKGNKWTISSKYDDSSDNKLQQNGSIKRETPSKKGPISSAKRPSADSSAGQSSSIKKAKLSDASTSGKANHISSKAWAKDDDDHIPIGQRLKGVSVSKAVPAKKASKFVSSKLKKVNKKSKKIMKKTNFSKSSKELPNSGDGQKWTTLVHSGVIFPPPYQLHGVKMLYNGKPVNLTPEQEEVATMYAVMLETDYVKKEKFNENFFSDWKKLLGKNHVIQDLSKCDFRPIHEWHLSEKEKKKQMTSEEKKALKEEKLKLEEKYMWAIVDGVKEKVGNFRVEPPGLFRGRGEHPKMGKLKKRIYPSDITINIGKDAPIPECPVPGQSWKEVRHDNTVTWLAYWNDPINPKEFKYVFLAASSTLKGQSDKEKYEKARKLKDYIEGIRKTYIKNFKSNDMTKKQIAVATYLIDRLALRAGNEKDDDEADTVGCCTLKVENVKPLKSPILEFDFLGKDSIKYYKQFEADIDVYNAVIKFREGKQGSDDLFDKLDTSKLNAHLKELMPGLTAKVFRTFNASITLDDMLAKGAGSGEVPEKITNYQHANKEVAIICNHQRTVSKSHSAQMDRLNTKIEEARAELSELKTDLDRAKKGKPPLKDSNGKQKRNLSPEAIEKKILSAKTKIEKYERDMNSKEDLKEIALGTSKINYLDPRITVAWCKRNEVPIEKIFNKSLLAKFSWAMDCDPSFRF